jgi:hypothetical protein
VWKQQVRLACALLAGVAWCDPASAVEYSDIAGMWCTGAGRAEVTPDRLNIEIKSNNAKYSFKINRFEYSPDAVTVYWVDNSGKEVRTVYSRFSADHKSMVQLKTETADERPHTRC